MNKIAIKVENLSKAYQLGNIGTGTISRDIERWWAKTRGKEDPFLRIGETNDRTTKSESNIVWSLKDINFEIQQGDAVGIIGRNGAGKSTLLKILSRVTAPTTGKISGNGRIASLLEVGTGFHPELTGRENIYLNGAILGMRKREIDRKFDEIVDFSGVERYIDTPVKRYSSGMYVRLAFAVAAHLESEILIVDEVLAVGDAEFQKKCLGKMGEVSKGEGRTVLFVSHNMGAINNLCSNVILLENGMNVFKGPASEGVKKYLNSNDQNQKKYFLKNIISNLPVDDVFELIDFSVTQENEKKIEFYTDMPISVKIEYQVKKDTIGLRIGFDLLETETDCLIFRSFHDDMDSQISIVKKGRYNTNAEIPSNLLNQGNFDLSLSVGIHNLRWIFFQKIRQSIKLNNINGVNRIYSEATPGLIRPALNWNIINED
jgi:lipopolysaccharide transport system ATP-binding protein